MIITIAHSKGGVGKSLLAWHLAIAMKVPIVDLDFQKTLVYVNSIRVQAGHKPQNIIHVKSTEEFIGLFDTWKDEDNIIIDVGGFDADVNRMAILLSDIVITPAVDRITEMAGLHKFHNILGEMSNKLGTEIKAHVLLNDVSPAAKDFSVMHELVDSLNNFEMMDTIVAHRADFYRSMEEGRGVTDLKKCKARKEIKLLVKEILKKGKADG